VNPEGIALPTPADPSKVDPKDLLDQISRLNAQIIRERQDATRRLTEERAKSRAEMDRLRHTTHQHGQDLQNQNSALLQSLGRMKAENDELRTQLIVLTAQGGNGTYTTTPRTQATPVDPETTVAILPQGPTLSGEELPPSMREQKS
jgi:hypothetical protein